MTRSAKYVMVIGSGLFVLALGYGWLTSAWADEPTAPPSQTFLSFLFLVLKLGGTACFCFLGGSRAGDNMQFEASSSTWRIP